MGASSSMNFIDSFRRDFPSLSGAPQPQYQTPSQAIWANQRTQQTPVQRPQQQQQQSAASQTPQHHQNQHLQDQPTRSNDDMYSMSSHLNSSATDDHRYGSNGTLGQLPASRQPQTTNVDDFPPLGRNGTDENDDRRSNLMQSSGFGGFSNPHPNAFSLPPDQAQGRVNLPSASISQANNTRSSSVVDRLTSPNGIGFGGKVVYADCCLVQVADYAPRCYKCAVSNRAKSSRSCGYVRA